MTTIFVRQGRHAHKPENVGPYPEPDMTIEKIGDLLDPDRRHFFDRWG